MENRALTEMVHRTYVWQVQTFRVSVIEIEYCLAAVINQVVVIAASIFLEIEFKKQFVRLWEVESSAVPRRFKFADPVVDLFKDIGSLNVGFGDDPMRSVVIVDQSFRMNKCNPVRERGTESIQ